MPTYRPLSMPAYLLSLWAGVCPYGSPSVPLALCMYCFPSMLMYRHLCLSPSLHAYVPLSMPTYRSLCLRIAFSPYERIALYANIWEKES